MAENKIIGLDLTKRDGFNKAITGRVGDSGNKYSFLLFSNGILFDLTQAKEIALLGLTPSGHYVDAVGVIQTDGTVLVTLPSAFNAEVGYFKRCFIRVTTKDNNFFSTQDLIYYSYGDADISSGQGADYISRVEDIVKKLNEVADDFESGLQEKYDDFETQLTTLTAQYQTLVNKMNTLINEGAMTKPDADKAYMHINGLITATVDWNTLKTVGTYTATNPTGSNKPTTDSGTLLVQGEAYNKGTTQLYISSNNMYFRRYSGTTWSSWNTLGSGVATQLVTEVNGDGTLKTQVQTALNIASVASLAEIQAGTVANKYVSPKGLKDSSVLGDSLTTEQVNTLISTAVSAIKTIQVGEWQPLTLNTGFKSADQTTVKYRITTYPDGRKKIEFDGAWTNDAGSIGSSGSTQSQWCILPQELRPAQTKMFPSQCSNFSTTGRVAFVNNGICYGAQNSGAAVNYMYVTGMSYWIGE